MNDHALQQEQGGREKEGRVSIPVALGALFFVLLVMMVGLWWMLDIARDQYGVGISLAEEAADKGANPSAMARRVFLLASAVQITCFKAAAFGVSAILALVGGIFILNGPGAAYRLSLENPDAGNARLRGALETNSPATPPPSPIDSPPGWVWLPKVGAYERAQWVTPRWLRDNLGNALLEGRVVRGPGAATKAAACKGDYVGLVDERGRLLELISRARLHEQMVERILDPRTVK